MSRFIGGADRNQTTLLPESLDDYIAEDNPVRAVDAFIEELDLGPMGFAGAEPAITGRPAYHPAMLLKVYLYGYLNRIASSRRLEGEGQRNVELMWLTGRLAPDFKTIADFRRDNGEGIQKVCSRFVQLCRELKLFSQAIVAIDSSKFKAVTSALVLGMGAAGIAQAALLTGAPIAESSAIVDGPITPFTWSFTGVPAGTGLASLLIHYVRLDTDVARIERLNVVVDGNALGNTSAVTGAGCVSGTSATFPNGFSSDCTASISFNFDTALLNDGSLDVTLSGNATVNAFIDSQNGAGLAEIEIRYQDADAAVPAPATLALLGLGFAGLGWSLRKK